MANTYHQIYLHFVFTIKYRNAIIQKNWSHTFFGVIGNLINESGGKTIIVNGVEDHVHCFAGLKPVACVSELVKYVKARSSKYINDRGLTPGRFEWQKGYGVFSYGQSQITQVYRYIENQEAHHRKQTFWEEYEDLLRKFGIEFEDRFVFQEPG